MATNKVILNGEVKIDLTKDTVKPEDVASGVTFHGADGEIKTGENVDAQKLKGARIVMGSKEPFEDGEDFYIPYIEEVLVSGQLPAFQFSELQNEKVWDTKNLKVHFPKAPAQSLRDNYGNAFPYLEVGTFWYFDDGFESYFNTLPWRDGEILTPQQLDSSNDFYYWTINESLPTYGSREVIIKGKNPQECTRKEIIDDSKITSVAPYSGRVFPSNYRGFESEPLKLENVKHIYIWGLSGFSYVQLCEGLEQIGAYALDNLNCSYYTIPSTVNYIGNGAFQYAMFHTLIVKCTTPPILMKGHEDFMYIYDDSTIFVPQGTKQAYLSATSWSNYGDIIYEIGEAATVTVNGVNYNYTIGETWEDLIGKHTELSGVKIVKTNQYEEAVTMDEPISPKIQYGISQEA